MPRHVMEEGVAMSRKHEKRMEKYARQASVAAGTARVRRRTRPRARVDRAESTAAQVEDVRRMGMVDQ